MLVLIRGAGDLATGIACRLFRSGFSVIMTDQAIPTAIRHTVAFSSAVNTGEVTVEGIRARLANDGEEALSIIRAGNVAVLVDPEGLSIPVLKPDAVVDAILAKTNLGTRLDHAPIVIGVGPGFTVNVDCHAAIETKRGHDLGRVLYEGAPEPNTGVPGEVGGATYERLIRTPVEGNFKPIAVIGDTVEAGQTIAFVGDTPITANIRGTLRGLLPEGTPVYKGMKSGDVDPRCCISHCYTISDKARAVGGGVLEAILNLSNNLSKQNEAQNAMTHRKNL